MLSLLESILYVIIGLGIFTGVFSWITWELLFAPYYCGSRHCNGHRRR